LGGGGRKAKLRACRRPRTRFARAHVVSPRQFLFVSVSLAPFSSSFFLLALFLGGVALSSLSPPSWTLWGRGRTHWRDPLFLVFLGCACEAPCFPHVSARFLSAIERVLFLFPFLFHYLTFLSYFPFHSVLSGLILLRGSVSVFTSSCSVSVLRFSVVRLPNYLRLWGAGWDPWDWTTCVRVYAVAPSWTLSVFCLLSFLLFTFFFTLLPILLFSCSFFFHSRALGLGPFSSRFPACSNADLVVSRFFFAGGILLRVALLPLWSDHRSCLALRSASPSRCVRRFRGRGWVWTWLWCSWGVQTSRTVGSLCRCGRGARGGRRAFARWTRFFFFFFVVMVPSCFIL
jgi:hypothetical protein